MTKKKIGRPRIKPGPKGPTKMTAEAVKKIEQGASYALNDTEICLYVGISRQTFYTYIKENPQLYDRIKELRESPTLKAKLNVVEKIIAKDIEQSKRRLERKSKAEFSKQDNIELTGKDGGPIEMTEKQIQAIASLQKKLGRNSTTV